MPKPNHHGTRGRVLSANEVVSCIPDNASIGFIVASGGICEVTKIVPGILIFALGCTSSTMIQQQVKSPISSTSYGYDRLRFINPVFLVILYVVSILFLELTMAAIRFILN